MRTALPFFLQHSVRKTGERVQRAEIRFDNVSGCLRTPGGGSSRQIVLIVEGPTIRARLISGRETARLMGLDDKYVLPRNYNEAYHLTGDGVAVPVVRHLAKRIFEPILSSALSVDERDSLQSEFDSEGEHSQGRARRKPRLRNPVQSLSDGWLFRDAEITR